MAAEADSSSTRTRRPVRPGMVSALYACYTLVALGVLLGMRFWGGPFLAGAMNAALDANGIHVTATGSAALDFWSAQLSLYDVKLHDPELGFFKAKRIALAVQPLQWSFDRLTVRELILDTPVFFADLTHLGDTAASSAAGPAKPPSPSKLFDWLRINHAVIHDAMILVQLSPTRSVLVQGLNLTSVYREEDGRHGYDLSLGAAKAQARVDDFFLPVDRLDLRAFAHDDTLSLQSLALDAMGNRLRLRGELDGIRYGGHMILSLEVPLESLSRLWPRLPAFSGRARLSLDVNGDWLKKDGKLKGTLRLRDGKVNWVRLEDADLRFRVDREGASLDGSSLYFAQGVIDVEKAHVGFRAPYPLNAAVTLKDVELAHILENVTPNIQSSTMQWHTGPAHMSGTLVPFKLEGAADLDVRDHSVNSAGFRERATGMPILGIARARVAVGLYADSGCFEIRKGKVYVGHSVVDVHVVHFGFDGWMNMSYSSEFTDLADIRYLLGLKLTGRGRLACELHGPYAEQELNAWIDMQDASINGFKLGHLRSKVHWKGRSLAFGDIAAAYTQGALGADVRFDFSTRPTSVFASLHTPGIRLGTLLESLALPASWHEHASGLVQGEAGLYGPFGDFSGHLALTLPSFTTREQRFDGASIEALLSHNDITVKHAEVTRGTSRAWLEGRILGYRELDGRLNSEGIDVSDIDFTAFALHDARGAVRVHGRVAGTMREPVVQLDAEVDTLTTPHGELGESELHLALTPDYLNLSAKLFGRAAEYRAHFQFAPVERVDMSLDLDAFPYAAIPRHLLGWPIEQGRVSGHATLEGPYRSLGTAHGEATLSELSLEGFGLKAHAVKPLVWSYENGVLRLEPSVVQVGDLPFSVHGSLARDGDLSLLVQGSHDLGALTSLMDGVEHASGPAEFRMSVSGTYAVPHVAGELTLSGGELKLRDSDTMLEAIQGHVSFENRRLLTDDLRFTYQGGTVEAHGQAQLDVAPFALHDVDMRLDIRRVGYVLDEGVRPLISGQLSVRGTPWPLDVRGQLRIDELDYTRSIRWQKKLVIDSVTNILKPRRRRETHTPVAHFAWRIGLSAPETIVVNNNLAKMKLIADLTLTHDDIAPGLLGTLSADRGQLYFENNTFDLTRFMVEFNQIDAIKPRLDIAAETTVSYVEDDEQKEARITLELSGPLSDPDVVLSSNTGLSQIDVLSLLMVGQPASKLQSQGGVATGLNALTDLYGVNEQIRDQFKLDIFRFTTEVETSAGGTSGTVVPKLEIGKEVTKNLTLTFGTSLANQDNRSDQRFTVRYKFKDFTLSGQWDNHSFSPQGNLGLDLSYSLDF